MLDKTVKRNPLIKRPVIALPLKQVYKRGGKAAQPSGNLLFLGYPAIFTESRKDLRIFS